jgi:hypothetical protein
MPNFSGSCAQTLRSQTMLPVPDRPDHMIVASSMAGTHTTSDPNWDGVQVTNWGTADLVAGSGEQRGYFLNEHPNGDVDGGTFEAKVTMSDTGQTMTGTWKTTHGTGKFAHITASGVLDAKMTSPTDSVMNWSGSYNLG